MSPDLDGERFFVVGWGEIELRHDCDYYRPAHVRLLAQMHASGWPVQPLRTLSPHIVDGPFGSAIKAEDYVETGVPFIRVADVTRGNGTIRTDQMIFISEEAHSAIHRSAASPGDIVVAKTGATMGAASIVPSTLPVANIRGDLALVGELGSELHASYLEAYFNSIIGYKLFWRLNSGSTRGRVVISNLKRYPVIWPEDAVKQRVVNVLAVARDRVAALETEAAALLASIDDYLLSELGIVLPPETENTLANRTFRVKAHELGGWRFDPPVHQSDFSLQSHTIESVPLGCICHVNPRTSFGRLHGGDSAGFVPMDAISDRLGIVEYQSERPIEECVGYTTFRDKDVLWAKITPCMENGKSAVVDGLANGVGFGSTEFHVIRPRNGAVMPDYVHALLRMGRVRREAKRFFTGSSGHRRVDDAFLRKLVIPIPPADIQIRLVQEIQTNRKQAMDLEKWAVAELETAKREIEAILLGDAA